MSQYLGDISAYALAVSQGYTGTEEEYAELMASYATVGQTAVTAAQTATTKASEAATSATTATNKASEATTAATTATTKAGEASTSANTATSAKDTAVSASQTATTKATEATTAAATATSAATTATTAKDDAVSAKTAAQTAQTGAETAAASVEASAAQIATNAADISQLKSEFTALESDGVVPSAEQILTNKGVMDCVPYHYRKTGGDGADRLYDQIVGGTVCFNQLVPNANKTFANTNTTDTRIYVMLRFIVGTSQIFKPIANVSTASMVETVLESPATGNGALIHNGTVRDFDLANYIPVVSGHKLFVHVKINSADPTTVGGISTDEQMIIDLTAMFGSTIADYIYSLETAHTGDGVAFFKSLFPNDYYPYNAGELVSVSGLSAHKMVGFNQFNKDDPTIVNGKVIDDNGVPTDAPYYFYSEYIPVLPNTEYYVGNFLATSTMHCGGYYDENKNFISAIRINNENRIKTTPSNCHYIIVCAQLVDKEKVCINLSDPTKNGTYEPYKAHSYPLDSTLTLRGLFKLDANNNLYADGDTYDADGTVTHNTILRAYQSGDESLANAITDGTNTVVYSANASTEQADPYQHLQQCDPDGTEEYVSTGIVPVGHNSFYPENLRAKVEGLPWNFANLIAPTEATFTATRNYVTGDLFIVNNVLYKATSNIANGGTITPNTNCTATTLAEIISALA